MSFGKYHILVFRDQGGSGRSLHLSVWPLVLIGVVFIALAAGNVWLWEHYLDSRAMKTRLGEAERALEDSEAQMISVMADLESVREDLERVRQFDDRLRLMMELENGGVDLAQGGASSEDMSLAMLPLHRQELAARRIRSFLRELGSDVRLEEVRQQELLVAMRENRERLALTPSIMPTEGFITSHFGYRHSPFTGQLQSHKGMDIAAKTGTPIYAPARGVVTAAGNEGAYGLCVDIRHGGGLSTRYAHMEKYVVETGQTVERGQLIGHVGRSGRATGPHLHYEVRLNGVPTNPAAYILN